MAEILLPLRTDQGGTLVLGASSLSSWLAAGIFAALSLGIGLLMPELQAAPLLFAGLGLWQAAQSLKRHELRIDGDRHHMTYIEGWRFRPPTYSGPYVGGSEPGQSTEGESRAHESAQLELRIEAHLGDPGLVASRLRSHKLILTCALPASDRGRSERLTFRIGYPMGLRAAEDRSQDLRQRLGLAVGEAVIVGSVAESRED